MWLKFALLVSSPQLSRFGGRATGTLYDLTMVREAPLEQTEAGLVPAGEGWFVLNRERRRERAPRRGQDLNIQTEDVNHRPARRPWAP